MTTPKIHNWLAPKTSKRSLAPSKTIHRLWLSVGLAGVAIASATTGALIALSLTSTPLLQSRLTPEEAKVFEQGNISSNAGLRLPALTRPVNILVLGVKVLSSEVSDPDPELQNLGYHAVVNSFEGLSDTMLLLRFNPADQKLVVLSIPRDTRTAVDGLGVTKLNEANLYGGPALSAVAVSTLLDDVPIDRYVRINVQGVEKLVDALGGVTVYVPHDMKYQDDSQHLYINLKQGEQHLNGNQALQFLRFRYDRYGDIGRVQRQQMLMRALLEQTLSPATLTRIPQILSVIQENIDTNLSVEELVALVGFASQVDRSKVQMLMLPGDFSEPGQYEASYWLPSYRRISEIVSQYFQDGSAYSAAVETVDASTIDSSLGYLSVAVQDSTGDDGATQSVVNLLQTAGYGEVFVDEPWGESLTTTKIIAQQGNIEAAEAIRRSLGLGQVRVESTGNLRSDITVQLGQDWQQQHEAAASSGALSDYEGSPQAESSEW